MWEQATRCWERRRERESEKERERVAMTTRHAAAILDVREAEWARARESGYAAAMLRLASSTQHSPAAAAVVKFCDVTEISEQETRPGQAQASQCRSVCGEYLPASAVTTVAATVERVRLRVPGPRHQATQGWMRWQRQRQRRQQRQQRGSEATSLR